MFGLSALVNEDGALPVLSRGRRTGSDTVGRVREDVTSHVTRIVSSRHAQGLGLTERRLQNTPSHTLEEDVIQAVYFLQLLPS